MGEWRLPEPIATVDALMADETTITVRRHGNPQGARLLLSHGCGLAADLYYPYWSLLTDRFDVCVFDLRSHGWNAVSPVRTFNIPTLVSDSRKVREFIDSQFGPKPCTGIFHSVSTIVALVQQRQAKGFAGLVLFDPPIALPGGRREEMDAVGRRLARRARRRQRHFDSLEQFAEMLGQAPAYALMGPATLQLLAETTLRPARDGGYELRCPPEHEGQLNEWHFGFALEAHQILESIDLPVKVIGADPTVRHSFMPGFDLSTLTYLDYDFLPDRTHFLQLESPGECAALTVEFLESHALA